MLVQYNTSTPTYVIILCRSLSVKLGVGHNCKSKFTPFVSAAVKRKVPFSLKKKEEEKKIGCECINSSGKRLSEVGILYSKEMG